MYLTGGATAVLEGWHERSRFRFREGNLEVFDFDPYSQALRELLEGIESSCTDSRQSIPQPQGCSRVARLA
jgi:hypothetical protein